MKDRLLHWIHPALRPTPGQNRRSASRSANFYLGQGSVDGACGPYSVFIALNVLGIVPPGYIKRVMGTRQGRFAEAFSLAQELYFRGTTDADMADMLDALSSSISFAKERGSARAIVEFTINHLRQANAVLLCVDYVGRNCGHWVLAVGYEEVMANRVRTVTGILCLDSAQAAPIMSHYSGRFEWESPRRKTQCHYLTADGSRKRVAFVSAFAIARRE